MDNKMITEFFLRSNTKVLFEGDDSYLVPLYQRAYAWTEKEIEQLIDDILDYSGEEYYIGSLIVARRNNNVYEVIDGQQRLTTIFLLFHVLGMSYPGKLSFECRDKSNYTLNHLSSSNFDEKLLEDGILLGKKIIEKKLNSEVKEKLTSKLEHVILYRIEVPSHTDLNRYFEIMNTRGEQLEQHDILKAQLMSYLKTDNERESFAILWEACSDMNGYVQMHIPRKYRDYLFGSGWDVVSEDSMGKLMDCLNTKKYIESISINEIINNSKYADSYTYDDDLEERVRFESIIDFPFFLIHILKVYISSKGIIHKDGTSKIVNELLDDKKLMDSFEYVLEGGIQDGEGIKPYEFALGFINCMTKCRFLFDEYILKREYPINDAEGVWSIKSLKVSGQKSYKKPHYIQTTYSYKNEKSKTYNYRNSYNIMIQSCLRVSYTSPKIMHWVTDLLRYLYSVDDIWHCPLVHNRAEDFARRAVAKDMEDYSKTGIYAKGVDTQHIVLNYLDYLLWKKDNCYSDFIFEFRTSVEHWYPQNPSDGTFPKWDNVNTFGNLCLIQRKVNSKFSNMAPEAKKSTFKEMIAKGSIKLRVMAKHTGSSLGWKETDYLRHEKEMLQLLWDDVKTVQQPKDKGTFED